MGGGTPAQRGGRRVPTTGGATMGGAPTSSPSLSKPAALRRAAVLRHHRRRRPRTRARAGHGRRSGATAGDTTHVRPRPRSCSSVSRGAPASPQYTTVQMHAYTHTHGIPRNGVDLILTIYYLPSEISRNFLSNLTMPCAVGWRACS